MQNIVKIKFFSFKSAFSLSLIYKLHIFFMSFQEWLVSAPRKGRKILLCTLATISIKFSSQIEQETTERHHRYCSKIKFGFVVKWYYMKQIRHFYKRCATIVSCKRQSENITRDVCINVLFKVNCSLRIVPVETLCCILENKWIVLCKVTNYKIFTFF